MAKNPFFCTVLLLASLLQCFPVRADAGERMEWGDLHWGIKYFLLQELVLDAPVRFEAGHRFDYLSETGLPGVQTIVLEMKANDCPFPELGSDLVLVKPDGVNPAGRDNRVAIRMEPGCHLEIYVEAADYYSASVFRD